MKEKNWFASFILLFIQMTITFCATQYLMEHVWHSSFWLIEAVTFVVVYGALELFRGLAPRLPVKKEVSEEGEPQKAYPYASPEQIPEEVLTELRLMVAVGDKIKAIKKVRELTGAGLRESKEFIEWTVEDTRGEQLKW